MKTTRALLFVLAGLILLATFAFAVLNLSLPVASLFEYGTGTLFTAGLFSMLLTGEGASERPPAPPRNTGRTSRPERCPPRQTFAHAA